MQRTRLIFLGGRILERGVSLREERGKLVSRHIAYGVTAPAQRSLPFDLTCNESKDRSVRDVVLSNYLGCHRSKREQVLEPFKSVS